MVKKSELIFIISLFILIMISHNSKAFSNEKNPILHMVKSNKHSQQIKNNSSSRKTIMINNVARSYYIFLPPNYNPQKSYPLLFVFHGGLRNAQSVLKTTRFRDYQDKYDFILIAPNGSGRFNKETFLTWNAGHCAGYAFSCKVNDPDFINSIIEQTANSYNIDRKRIYLTGMSNGAMLCYKITNVLSDKIAGIAPVSGAMNYKNLTHKKPIPVIIFHGTDDKRVLYNGGIPLHFLEEKTRVDEPISYAVNFWVKNNKCDAKPITTKKGNIVIDKYTNCENNANVILYTIMGGEHSWPGGRKDWLMGDKPSMEINASKIILDGFIKNNF